MHDFDLDPVAALLCDAPWVAVPVSDLAARLPDPVRGTADPVLLERALRLDPRFAVLDGIPAFVCGTGWTATQRAAYAPALRRAGLPGEPVVVALHPEPDRSGLIGLLRETVARVAAGRPESDLALAAERTRVALAKVNLDAAAPSTSPPPPAPPAGRVRRRWRRPAPRRFPPP